jgi:hemoglobin/transferrin/lactoferrin receptor protein
MSNNLKISAVILAISTFLTQPAFSAEVKNETKKDTSQTEGEITKFDAVTVVASKSPRKALTFPAQVSVLEFGSSNATSNTTRVSNIQNKVAGLSFYGGPRSTAETPQLRGFTQKDIIVTVDGKKQNFDSVHDGRFFVDPQLLKKVEVVKGPSSALYGSGGLGGVVAFETKDAKDVVKAGQKIGHETSIGFNSANTQILASQISGMVGDNYDALAAITGSKGDDIRLGDGSTSRDDSRVLSGLAKVSYNLNDKTTLKFDASTFMGEGQAPNNPQTGPGDTTAVNKVDRSNVENSFGAKLNYNADNNLVDLNTHVYFNTTEVEERVLQGSSLNAARSLLSNEMETIGLTIDNKSKVENLAGVAHTFTYGVEYINNTMSGADSARAFRFGVPSAEAEQMGAFIQDELRFAGFTGSDSSFYVIPAARFDSFENQADDPTLPSQDESQVSPKIAATYEFNKNYNVFSSYGQAFRAPTLTELYLRGTHFPVGGPFTNSFVPNPNLKPETATTFEYGVGASFDAVIQKSDKITFKASRFETKAEDYIDQYIIQGGGNGTTGFRNVDEARIWGYEAEVNYLSDLYRAQIIAGYTTGKNAATSANLGTNDAFKVKTDVAYTIPNTSFEIGYLGKFAKGFDEVAPSTFGALDRINYVRDGYAVHGLYTEYNGKDKLDGFIFNVGVDNIFDTEYAETQARNYEIGRSLTTRVTYKW